MKNKKRNPLHHRVNSCIVYLLNDKKQSYARKAHVYKENPRIKQYKAEKGISWATQEEIPKEE